MPPMQTTNSSAFRVKPWMDRTLTVGATGGTFSALALRLLSDLSSPSVLPYPLDCPLCPESVPLDWFSLVIGICIGLSLGLCLDLLNIVRQSWRLWVRDRLAVLARRTLEGKYRIV